MIYNKSPYESAPNILDHPDRTVKAVTLDFQGADCILAGSPISADGKVSNDEHAIGILLEDVYAGYGSGRGQVVIAGVIEQDVAKDHSGITISDAAKSAMVNVSFTGDGNRMLPFYEEKKKVISPLNLTWDGNTEGLVCVKGIAYKVSDDVFTDEQIMKTSVTLSNGQIHSVSDMYALGLIESTEDAVLSDTVLIIRKSGFVIDPDDPSGGSRFDECGVYIIKQNDDPYVIAITSTDPIEHTETIIHKIDGKFLPGIPYFDLVERGLGPVSNKILVLEGGMAEICDALEKGPVIFRFNIEALDGAIVDTKKVVTASRCDIPGVGVMHQSNEIIVGSPTSPFVLFRIYFFINEGGDFMNVMAIPMNFATGLEVHFSEDTGKFTSAYLNMPDGTKIEATYFGKAAYDSRS